MSDYAISVKNISKKFKLYHEKRDSIFEVATSFFQKKRHHEILQVLDDVSFNVKHGEIFGIIGIAYAMTLSISGQTILFFFLNKKYITGGIY